MTDTETTGVSKEVAEQILWAPDHSGVDKMYDIATKGVGTRDLEPWEWVGGLKMVANRGVCLAMDKEVGRARAFLNYHGRSYELAGPGVPSDEKADGLSPSDAEAVISMADIIWPVLREESVFDDE